MPLNLTGRAIGELYDGMILVKLTKQEYQANMPTRMAPQQRAFGHAPFGQPRRPGASTVPTAPVPIEPKPVKAGVRKDYELRLCEFCKASFKPRRFDQTVCSSVCRKKLNTVRWNQKRNQQDLVRSSPKERRAPVVALAKAMITTVGILTPEQKQARLDLIRQKLRDIDARKRPSGESFALDKPAELAQAEREAAAE